MIACLNCSRVLPASPASVFDQACAHVDMLGRPCRHPYIGGVIGRVRRSENWSDGARWSDELRPSTWDIDETYVQPMLASLYTAPNGEHHTIARDYRAIPMRPSPRNPSPIAPEPASPKIVTYKRGSLLAGEPAFSAWTWRYERVPCGRVALVHVHHDPGDAPERENPCKVVDKWVRS